MRKLFLMIVLVSFSVLANAYDFCVNGIYYNIVSIPNRTVEVTNNLGRRIDTTASFDGNSNYTGIIIIPSTVTFKGKAFKVIGIGEQAFYKARISEVKLPEGIIYVGTSAFSYVRNLKINLPKSLKEIGLETFKGVNVGTFSIPNSVKTIGANALPFATCIRIEDGNTPIEIGHFIDFQAEEIYVGRLFTTDGPPYDYVNFSNPTTFVIGKLVKDVTPLFNFSLPNNTTIIVKGTIPPQLASLHSKDILMNCIVEVPISSLQTYQKAEGWRDFFNLEGK